MPSSEEEICPVCSFPKDLCICEGLAAEKQQIIISNAKRKWGKDVTLVEFQGDFDVDLDDLLSKAKRKCASGGTLRHNKLEIRGLHNFKLKKYLINLGFPKENIIIKE